MYICIYICMYTCIGQRFIHLTTHPFLRYDASIRVTWLVLTCHPYMWHDSSICVTWLMDSCAGDTLSKEIRMTWLIGSLIFIGHFSQKRPIFSGSLVENDLQLRGSNESSPLCMTWLIHTCETSRIHMCDMNDSFICVTWPMDADYLLQLGHMHDAAHPYVWRVSFICVTWLIHMCDMTWLIHMCTWLIHMCDMTHSHLWHDSFTCVKRLNHMCDMTLSYVWRDSSTRATWCFHMCDVTHPYVYGVATMSRLLKMIGLFRRISSVL